jgi:hypothetical protein
MPLQRSPGRVISACEGVYFPMASTASRHRPTCFAARTLLQSLAGRSLTTGEVVATFNSYRRAIEAVASMLYDRKRKPGTVVLGVRELYLFSPGSTTKYAGATIPSLTRGVLCHRLAS